MHLTCSAGFSEVTYDSDASGFSVRTRFSSHRVPWESVTGGGMLLQNDAAIAAAGPLRAIPIVSYLIRKNEEMNRTTRRVWLAWRKPSGRKAVESLAVPRTTEGEAMLSELRSHCPEWNNEPRLMLSVRRAHGLSNTYAIVLTLLFVPVVGVVLLLILLGAAFVLAGVQWLAVKFWWIVVFGIGFYWVYRKLKNPIS
jgi:hypothetical protein